MAWRSGGQNLWGKMMFSEIDVAITYSDLPGLNGIIFGEGFVKNKPTGVIQVYASDDKYKNQSVQNVLCQLVINKAL